LAYHVKIMKINCGKCPRILEINENQYPQGSNQTIKCLCGHTITFHIPEQGDPKSGQKQESESKDEPTKKTKEDGKNGKNEGLDGGNTASSSSENRDNDNKGDKGKDDDKGKGKGGKNGSDNGGEKGPGGGKRCFIICVIAAVCLICVAVLIYLILPNQGETRYVLAETLNIRKEPTTSSDTICKIVYGDSVEFLNSESKNDTTWAYVRFKNKIGKKVKGYAVFDCLVPKSTIDSLDNIFVNDTARISIRHTFYKRALLNFYNRNQLKTGQKGWQFASKGLKVKPNTFKLDYAYHSSKDNKIRDLFVILENKDEKKAILVAYSINSKEIPKFEDQENISMGMTIESVDTTGVFIYVKMTNGDSIPLSKKNYD